MTLFSNPFRKKSAEILDTPDKIATALEEYLSSYQSETGMKVTKDTAMRAATVFGCVRVLCESVGMLPCKLFEQAGLSKNTATDHWLYQLLAVQPNGYMTPQEFWELVVANLSWSGNFYAYKVRVRDEVRELLPLANSSVKPKLGSDWVPEYEVTFANGKKETLTQDDIWHVRLFSKDGLNGLSPIAYARESIGLSLAAQKQGARWFANGVAPSGVLSTDSKLTNDAMDRLAKQFKEKHVGSSNISNPLILELGLKWLSTSMNAQDLQFLETRKFQRDEICAMFRVPPHMVANMDKATFSNIEHQSLSFVTNSLVPYLTRIEQRISIGLIPHGDRAKYFAKFNTGALLRGDMKARFESYRTGIQHGILSPNEARAFEDWNPREGGDIYLTPMNMTTDPEADESENKKP
ncbi:MAG: phage portal protein [Agarilytica sp.]